MFAEGRNYRVVRGAATSLVDQRTATTIATLRPQRRVCLVLNPSVVFPLPVENGLRWAVLFLYL
jgi:hypothetical protein